MSSYRTARRGIQFFDIFTVFEADGETPRSGETVFAVRFTRDNTAQTLTYTITEVGTTGDYILEIPAGFPTNGVWSVTVVPAFNNTTWRSEVEVRDEDVDSLAGLIGTSMGAEVVNFTYEDASNGNIPIPDLLVNIYDATGAVFITFGRTNPSGIASFLIDDGDYVIRGFKPGVACSDETITVLDTGGTTPQDFTFECDSVLVAPPSSPQLCRLYADFLSFDGLPFENFKLKVENLYDPIPEVVAVVERVRNYESDAAGHVEFDVVRGTKLRVAFETTPWVRDLEVPDKPVENLLTAMGLATDVFQVVKK